MAFIFRAHGRPSRSAPQNGGAIAERPAQTPITGAEQFRHQSHSPPAADTGRTRPPVRRTRPASVHRPRRVLGCAVHIALAPARIEAAGHTAPARAPEGTAPAAGPARTGFVAELARTALVAEPAHTALAAEPARTEPAPAAGPARTGFAAAHTATVAGIECTGPVAGSGRIELAEPAGHTESERGASALDAEQLGIESEAVGKHIELSEFAATQIVELLMECSSRRRHRQVLKVLQILPSVL